ncbi:MAG: nitroreductase family protein [Methanosarcinales archaeon]
MEVYEAIEKRISVRKFKPDSISDEILQKILHAGTLAPNAFNSQPWEFIIIKDQDLKEKLIEMRAHIPRQKEALSTAPVILVVCYYKEHGVDAVASAYTCIENMLLAATDEGLGAVTLTFHGKKIKRILKIPKGIDVAAVIPIGYPAEIPVKPPRIPINEKIHLNTW